MKICKRNGEIMDLIWVLGVLSLILISPLDAIPTSIQTESSNDEAEFRLDDSVIPVHYGISLIPYLLKDETDKQLFTFDGSTTITVITDKTDVKTITLHAENLNITKITYQKPNEKLITIKDFRIDTLTDKLTFNLTETMIQKTEYFINFEYVGELRSDMIGFYRSNYKNANRNEIWIASTHFVQTNARKAFPCFDEPKFKATFQVDIIRNNKYHTVSNTEILESVTIDSTHTKDIFKTTPKMSTYLLAFLVSDFKARGSGKKFSVIARPEAFNQTNYAFEIGQKLLEVMDNYTALPYYEMDNITKMDLAAIPDLNDGAMENWGLITYRETALLYDDENSMKISKQRIATVIAHEQAHMWFGNLVTCNWWGVTWLNEGFARYFEYLTTEKVERSWALDKQFVVDQIHNVFITDSLNSSYPLSKKDVKTPNDAKSMFGTITYNKGASIIRMINHILGEATFQNALQKYLQKYQYGTGVPQALFNEFIEEIEPDQKYNINYVEMFEDWTTQEGFPLVTITVSEDRKSVTITQKRFLLKDNAGDASLRWTIPFNYATNKNIDFVSTKPKLFLRKSKDETKVEFAEEIDWIIGNVQQTGYYRINYDEQTWLNIGEALKKDDFSNIHEINRAQIVDDLFNLARAGIVDYNFIFDILEFLEHETSYYPWNAAFKGFNFLAIRLGNNKIELYSKLILRYIGKLYIKLDYTPKKDERHVDVYNRNKVLDWACKHGHSNCIETAIELFSNFTTNGETIPVDVRDIVYCTVMRQEGEKYYELLWEKYLAENLASEKLVKLQAFGCLKSKELVNRQFDRIFENNVRLQDKLAALNALCAGNPENVDMVFKILLANHKTIAQSSPTLEIAAGYITQISTYLTTKDQYGLLGSFYDTNKDYYGKSAYIIKGALDTVKNNLDWSNENIEKFLDYLTEAYGGSSRQSFNIFLIFGLVLFSFRIL